MAKSKETPATETKQITIQGLPVQVTQPYAEGHVVTEAEAKALNQVRAENIGNNMRKKLKELLAKHEGSVDAAVDEAQAMVAEADAAYQFTLASVGGGSTAKLSPLEKEARKIARDAISAKLREMGKTQKEYLAENGEDALKIKIAELSENPQVLEIAQKNLDQRAPAPEISL